MQEESALEHMLRDAWHEPGLRPAFYKRLLESEVLVPIQAGGEQRRSRVIGAGDTLQVITLVRKDRVGVIPFFTSAPRLFDDAAATGQCVRMIVRELFESRPDMHFHLNPFSRYGREFSPADVRCLLETGGIASTDPVVIGYDGEPDLRAPSQPPTEILSALRVAFARNFDVRAAYIAECCHPEPGAEQMLLVMDLKDGADEMRAVREAGTVIRELSEAETPRFAVARLLRDGSPVACYFLDQADPFYTIGVAGSLASTTIHS
jgi:hypothetical protein